MAQNNLCKFGILLLGFLRVELSFGFKFSAKDMDSRAWEQVEQQMNLSFFATVIYCEKGSRDKPRKENHSFTPFFATHTNVEVHTFNMFFNGFFLELFPLTWHKIYLLSATAVKCHAPTLRTQSFSWPFPLNCVRVTCFPEQKVQVSPVQSIKKQFWVKVFSTNLSALTCWFFFWRRIREVEICRTKTDGQDAACCAWYFFFPFFMMHEVPKTR